MPFEKGKVPEGSSPFKPGETGNPDGRPVGAITFKSIAEKILDGEITIEQAGEKRKITRREKMILNIINDAVNDEDPNIRLKALAYIMDRTEGKVPDKVDLKIDETVKSGSELSKEQEQRILEALKNQ